MEQYSDSLNIKTLLTFILGFNSIGFLCAAEAPKYNLECLNDYMVTISCVLNIPIDPLYNGKDSYWLKFEGSDTSFSSNITNVECLLENQKDNYCCTFKSKEQFIDTEYFVISFCSNKNVTKLCVEMDKFYQPKHHIKPMTPINLKFNWSSGHYRFIWDSGYEHNKAQTFMKRLMYQLQYYKHGHPESAIRIHSLNKSQQIDGFKFEPGTEYIAKVCSGPAQGFYKGQWSDWSTAVKWRTNVTKVTKEDQELLFIGVFSILACMLFAILVFIYFHPIDRCWIKSHNSVPTPTPYFRSLYSDYNGDIQSWLVSQSKLGEPFTPETLKFETLIEATPMENEERFFPSPSIGPYINAKQDRLDKLPVQSMQNSLSLQQMGTSRDDWGSQDLIHSCATVSSTEPQCMYCSKDYCTLTDTNNDQGHRKLSQ
ncbi:hypothetical protein COCON_G00030000 [Conger conger]|uniref:Uncharacterized protein n=1 Tax=Conger conger TaxID=82655 RepID=A0A9Q1DYI6_CONCO|nr:interleukin-21 receptor-like [Conger conger]KAJ8284150.1 hypothetical protein COCON_G00030000 [Conger conger]